MSHSIVPSRVKSEESSNAVVFSHVVDSQRCLGFNAIRCSFAGIVVILPS